MLHAGTARDAEGTLVSSGGRVLSVVATGATLAQARERVYTAVDVVELAGSHHRTDIALKAAARRGHRLDPDSSQLSLRVFSGMPPPARTSAARSASAVSATFWLHGP